MIDKRLLIVSYGTSIVLDGKVYLNAMLGRYFDCLARYFREVTIAQQAFTSDNWPESFRERNKPIYQYVIRGSNVEFLHLASTESIFGKRMVYIKRLAQLYLHTRHVDLVYLFVPSSHAFAAYVATRSLRKPYAVYVGVDWQEILAARWPNSPTVKILSQILALFELNLIRGSVLTMVAGKGLSQKFRKAGLRVFETKPLIWLTSSDFAEPSSNKQISSPLKCLFVGSLREVKGLSFLLKAIALLKQQSYAVTLTIVGRGGEEQRLRYQVHQLGIGGEVIFAGYAASTEKLLQYYREADVFVLPSLAEGFPRCIYEAMSQSLPVVASNIGTIASVLRHEQDCLLVPPRSAESLAAAIRRLGSDMGLRSRLIENGHKFARERVQDDDPSAQFIELLMDRLGS